MFGSILKYPASICKPCTRQSTRQQALHRNPYPSAGWFHASFLACNLGIKSPLPLPPSYLANEQPYRFFHKRWHLLSFQRFPFLNEVMQVYRLAEATEENGKKKESSLQGKERIISLICICITSGLILIKDFEHHNSMPILASSFSKG